MNNIYQNTTTKISSPERKVWTKPLPLQSSKSKNFQLPDFEIVLLIGSEAESKIIKISFVQQIRERLNYQLNQTKTWTKQAYTLNFWADIL